MARFTTLAMMRWVAKVIALNSSGTIIGSQLYGPYGNQRYSTGTLPTSIGFTSQRADSVTGLDYYGARYYDPVVGVFLSADSVQGNAQGMEPYAYVGGNPETMTDPTGQRFIGSNPGEYGWVNLDGDGSGGRTITTFYPANPMGLSAGGGLIEDVTHLIKPAKDDPNQTYETDSVTGQVHVPPSQGQTQGGGILGTIIGIAIGLFVAAAAAAIAAFLAKSGRAVQDIANQLAKKAKGQKSGNKEENYGAGDLSFNGSNDHQQQTFGSTPAKHTEQQIIDWVLGQIKLQKKGSITSIRLIMFTMRAPCPGSCLLNLTQGKWAKQLAAAAGISVDKVQILVYTQYGSENGAVESWNPLDPRNKSR
ncbi:MAG: RHS repeat-associated core domain-containing protein [Ktedonobacteraceae bacterium]